MLNKVFVTGAGGFIGSHLVERLILDGYSVRALVRYTSSSDIGHLRYLRPDLLKEVEIVFGDIRDESQMFNSIKKIDTVFHLAALIGIPYSYDAPRSYVDTNLLGTCNILEACRRNAVEKLVHTSTSEVYGSAQYIPMNEKHPLVAQSPYSASKIAADKLVESYALSFGLPQVTVRPFNTFGPRQSERAIIPSVIKQALLGQTIRVGSLHPERDFTYVNDTVDGFVAASKYNGNHIGGINLGMGNAISIEDLIRTVQRLIGSEANVVQEDIRVRPENSEVNLLLSDNSLAGSLFGWSPKFSIEEGLISTIEFFEKHSLTKEYGSYVV